VPRKGENIGSVIRLKERGEGGLSLTLKLLQLRRPKVPRGAGKEPGEKAGEAPFGARREDAQTGFAEGEVERSWGLVQGERERGRGSIHQRGGGSLNR